MAGLTDNQKTTARQLMGTMSWRSIAKHLGVPKSTISDYLRKVSKDNDDSSEGPKIAFIDVESQGTVALTHGRFKTNISPKGVISEPYLLSYAVNWAHQDESEVECVGLHHLPSWEENHRNDILLVERLWEILDEADVVIAHNISFDERVINARFAYWGLEPPSPYKVVCTLKALRKYFRLPANNLDAATRYFELERKLDNAGIGLWLRCYEGDTEAMRELCNYNAGDIPTLRQLYYRTLPYIKDHPQMSHYFHDDSPRCRMCGHDSLVEIEGKNSYTTLSRFEAYRCEGCGAVQRSRKNTYDSHKMKNMLM